MQLQWPEYLKWKKIRRSLETPNKKLAEGIEAKIRTEIIEGKYFEKPIGQKKTLRDLVTKFMVKHAPTVSESMQTSYKCSLKPLLSFFWNLNLVSFTPDKISNYKVKRRNEGLKPELLTRNLQC